MFKISSFVQYTTISRALPLQWCLCINYCYNNYYNHYFYNYFYKYFYNYYYLYNYYLYNYYFYNYYFYNYDIYKHGNNKYFIESYCQLIYNFQALILSLVYLFGQFTYREAKCYGIFNNFDLLLLIFFELHGEGITFYT